MLPFPTDGSPVHNLFLKERPTMASQAQIDANRLNAQLSTGPTSPEGKAKVSQNRTDHGYSAKTPFVPDELKPDFEALKARLLDACRPHGELETEIAGRLIHSAWVLSQLDAHEADLLFNSSLNPFTEDKPAKGLALILRYRTTHTSTFYRNLKELRQLQTDRAALSGFHERLQAPFHHESPLAYITRLTKHTDLAISLDGHHRAIQMEFEKRIEQGQRNARAQTTANSPEDKAEQFKATCERMETILEAIHAARGALKAQLGV